MGKKVRYQYLQGSLLRPLFQFTNKMQLGINPVSDPRGTKIAQHWYQIAKNTKPKFKAQNFEAVMDYDLKTSSSYMILNFVNGWKHGFFLRDSKVIDIIQYQKMINHVIEFQRACQGQEDEYQDQQA